MNDNDSNKTNSKTKAKRAGAKPLESIRSLRREVGRLRKLVKKYEASLFRP